MNLGKQAAKRVAKGDNLWKVTVYYLKSANVKHETSVLTKLGESLLKGHAVSIGYNISRKMYALSK
jgi:hypothetical protein